MKSQNIVNIVNMYIQYLQLLLSNPRGRGDVAGHVVGDDDVIVVVNNDILTVLLIALEHQERFYLNKGRFNNLRH